MKNRKERQDGPVRLRSPKGVAPSLMTEVESDDDSVSTSVVSKSAKDSNEKTWNNDTDTSNLILPIGNGK